MCKATLKQDVVTPFYSTVVREVQTAKLHCENRAVSEAKDLVTGVTIHKGISFLH